MSVRLESLYAEQVLVFPSLLTKLREFVQHFVQIALLLKQQDFTMTQTSLRMDGRVVGPGLALKIVDTFLNTPFSGDERHISRIYMIEE